MWSLPSQPPPGPHPGGSWSTGLGAHMHARHDRHAGSHPHLPPPQPSCAITYTSTLSVPLVASRTPPTNAWGASGGGLRATVAEGDGAVKSDNSTRRAIAHLAGAAACGAVCMVYWT